MMFDQIIWDFLNSKLKNPVGTAALMGNLYVESKLNPKNLQDRFQRKWSLSDEEYTKAVDAGAYSSFIEDGAGYGLAQWTYWSRKEALYKYALSRGVSIGDLEMQLNFLWKEIQTYKTVINALKTGTDIRTVSDLVCTKYLKPADQSEKSLKTRAEYAFKFYDYFAKNTPNSASKVVTLLRDKVNIRSGNSVDFAQISRGNKNDIYEWVATAENGWHAILLSDRVGWVSGEFSEVKKV